MGPSRRMMETPTMSPASDASLLHVLDFCGDGSRHRDGADARSGRSGPVVATGGTGSVNDGRTMISVATTTE